MMRTLMQTRYVERHIRSLAIARSCADLGARVRTIAYITGLERKELRRLFFVDAQSAPRGRAPDSPEWYHQANLLEKVEAAIVVAIFRKLRDLGCSPDDALVGCFRQYLKQCKQLPRVSFDRAFDLVCHIHGIWITDRPHLALASCPQCGSQHITAVGGNPNDGRACPFCRLVKRYRVDQRIQASFPFRSLPDLSSIEFGLLSAVLKVER